MSNPPDREQIARMKAIVRRMPSPTREIFLACRVGGLSYEEIARRTGLTTQEVERHLVEAILLLDRGLRSKPRRWWKFW